MLETTEIDLWRRNNSVNNEGKTHKDKTTESWYEHFQRMEKPRFAKKILNWTPKEKKEGRGRVGEKALTNGDWELEVLAERFKPDLYIYIQDNLHAPIIHFNFKLIFE